MVNDTAIICSEISKSYGEIDALSDFNLIVETGEVFGIIGPDGSGKTTLFRLIASLLIPDTGSISVLGFDTVRDYRDIRKKLGYMPGRFSLYPDLSVEENLAFYASVYGTSIKKNYHLIKDVYSHIEPFKNRRAGKLSGGMKQKLALSCALIHSPEILILDEPTTGVDAVSRREFWEMLNKLRKIGITIIVSTPYMDEARRCNRIALIQKGKILDVESPEMIIKKLDLKLFAVRSIERHEIKKVLQSFEMVHQTYLAGQLLHFTINKGTTEGVEQLLQNKGFKNFEIMPVQADIEDCFINMMKA